MAASASVAATGGGRVAWRYLPFGLIYAVFAGIAGIALPVFARSPAVAGAAYALLNLGVAVGAPLWGWLGRRLGGRATVAGATLAAALAFVAWAAPSPPLLLLTAFIFGVFAAAGMTLATVFIMSWFPRPQWDEQIGLLQTWMGAGQAAGLIAAGLITRPLPLTVLGGVALALGGAVALTLPGIPAGTRPPPHAPRVPAHPEAAGALPTHHLSVFHPRQWAIFKERDLLRFLLRWGLTMLSAAPVFAFYPLLMAQRFGVGQNVAAWNFAVATLLGIVLYRLAGRWSARRGTTSVLQAGRIARGLALLLLAIGVFTRAPGIVGLVGFAIIVLSWPLLSVASNARVTELAPADAAGADLGSYYTVSMLGNVLGSTAGGLLVPVAGYGVTLILSTALIGIAGAWSAFDSLASRTVRRK